jgi:hypothetical protein
MRKRIINQDSGQEASPGVENWLDLDTLAEAQVTSEDPARPIESALAPDAGVGWRALEPGRQTVRLVFDKPQPVRRIHLVFDESEQERTHEFTLRWSPDGGRTYREIARQQYNFSPLGTTRECEDYRVDLDGVTILELWIVPSISGGSARASVARLRVG